MYKHLLTGCRPRPLASYLKAIGLLRILSEQNDANAKGSWDGEVFVLSTELDQIGLEAFFCDEYAPTPIIAPWNGGSGFYLGDSAEGINAIAGSVLRRLEMYRDIIRQIRAWEEMPRFETFGDLEQTLYKAIEQSRPGKKRAELERLLAEIQSVSEVLGNVCLQTFLDTFA